MVEQALAAAEQDGHDRGTDPFVGTRDEAVVDASRSSVHAVQPASGLGGERPLVESGTAHTERVLAALIGSGPIPVERDREVVHTQLRYRRHRLLPASRVGEL